MFANFFAFNRKLCMRLAGFFPQATFNIFSLYERVVGQHLNSQLDQVILDVGGENHVHLPTIGRGRITVKLLLSI
jgi:hypothetical protein